MYNVYVLYKTISYYLFNNPSLFTCYLIQVIYLYYRNMKNTCFIVVTITECTLSEYRKCEKIKITTR